VRVSLGYFTILLIGFLLWIAYGVAAGIPALVIPSSVALLVRVAVVIVALRLRHRSGGKRSPWLIAGHSSNEHDANSQAWGAAPRGGQGHGLLPAPMPPVVPHPQPGLTRGHRR
jgi:hypothetical protein